MVTILSVVESGCAFPLSEDDLQMAVVSLNMFDH